MNYLIAYARKNLGDDLFIKMLLERYPNEEFYICANKKYLTPFMKNKNLHFPSLIKYYFLGGINRLRKNSNGSLDKIMEKNSDSLIKIGGSIYIEPKDFVKIDRYKNENLFILGSNYGPVNSEKFENSIKNEIKSAKDCCFRDKYSFDRFKEFKNVRYAPDIIFGYENIPEHNDKKGIGISVIDLSIHSNLKHKIVNYEDMIKDIIIFYRKQQIPVTLYSFCESEGDENAINRIVEKLPKGYNVDTFFYSDNIEEFLESFNSNNIIISSRFHAMILGWKMRKKVLPIMYSIKHKNVISDLDKKILNIDLLSEEEININKILNEFESVNVIDENILNNIEEQSKQHFRELDKFFKVSI